VLHKCLWDTKNWPTFHVLFYGLQLDHPVLRYRSNVYPSTFLITRATAFCVSYDAVILTGSQGGNGKRNRQVPENIQSHIHVCQQWKFYCLCLNRYRIIRLRVMCTRSRPEGWSQSQLKFLQSVDVTFGLTKLWSVRCFSSFWLWFLDSKCRLCYSQWWQQCSKGHSAWN
jgi:hypothetical protein